MTSYPVVLLPSLSTFTTDGETSVLMAAQAAGIKLPSSCRNGTCRTCMCRMLTGAVVYRIEWPGLSRDEKEEGWILPCVAHATAPLELDCPEAGPLEQRAAPPVNVTGARR